MNRTVHPCSLTDEQAQSLIQSLLKLTHREDCEKKPVYWERLPDMQSDLAHYSPETLRVYMTICSFCWLMQDFEDHGDYFIDGLTRRGKLKDSGKKHALRQSTGESIFSAILCFVVMQGFSPVVAKESFSFLFHAIMQLFTGQR